MNSVLVAPEKEAAPPTQKEALSALAESLLAQGAIPFIPKGRSGPAPRPVPVRGEPVSETISAERR